MIDNSSYQQIGRVHAGNGYKADLHDFHITPQGTALLTVFDPIDCNLSSLGGPGGGAVTDSDLPGTRPATGLVRREWHSVDHVPLADSYSSAVRHDHAVAVRLLPPQLDRPARQRHDADLGAQHVGAVRTEHAHRPGAHAHRRQALERQARRRRRDRLPARRDRAAQRRRSACSTTAPCPRSTRSRAASCSCRRPAATDRHACSRSTSIPTPLSSGSQGSVQTARPTATCSSAGAQSPTSRSSAPAGSCCSTPTCTAPTSPIAPTASPGRARRPAPPAIAAGASSGGAPVTVYASWNGDTRTATWRVLAGPCAQQLAPVAERRAQRL